MSMEEMRPQPLVFGTKRLVVRVGAERGLGELTEKAVPGPVFRVAKGMGLRGAGDGLTLNLNEMEAAPPKIALEFYIAMPGQGAFYMVKIGSPRAMTMQRPWKTKGFIGRLMNQTRAVRDEGSRETWTRRWLEPALGRSLPAALALKW